VRQINGDKLLELLSFAFERRQVVVFHHSSRWRRAEPRLGKQVFVKNRRRHRCVGNTLIWCVLGCGMALLGAKHNVSDEGFIGPKKAPAFAGANLGEHWAQKLWRTPRSKPDEL
jgi:hypothetical protein